MLQPEHRESGDRPYSAFRDRQSPGLPDFMDAESPGDRPAPAPGPRTLWPHPPRFADAKLPLPVPPRGWSSPKPGANWPPSPGGTPKAPTWNYPLPSGAGLTPLDKALLDRWGTLGLMSCDALLSEFSTSQATLISSLEQAINASVLEELHSYCADSLFVDSVNAALEPCLGGQAADCDHALHAMAAALGISDLSAGLNALVFADLLRDIAVYVVGAPEPTPEVLAQVEQQFWPVAGFAICLIEVLWQLTRYDLSILQSWQNLFQVAAKFQIPFSDIKKSPRWYCLDSVRSYAIQKFLGFSALVDFQNSPGWILSGSSPLIATYQHAAIAYALLVIRSCPLPAATAPLAGLASADFALGLACKSVVDPKSPGTACAFAWKVWQSGPGLTKPSTIATVAVEAALLAQPRCGGWLS